MDYFPGDSMNEALCQLSGATDEEISEPKRMEVVEEQGGQGISRNQTFQPITGGSDSTNSRTATGTSGETSAEVEGLQK